MVLYLNVLVLLIYSTRVFIVSMTD